MIHFIYRLSYIKDCVLAHILDERIKHCNELIKTGNIAGDKNLVDNSLQEAHEFKERMIETNNRAKNLAFNYKNSLHLAIVA